MARIRSIKPGYCTSEAIAALTIECELHFAKLWTYCDDHGRALDNPRLIKAAIWPLRDEVTIAHIEEWQRELEKHERIVRYSADGKNLFEVLNWDEHQKPQHPKESEYPSCDSDDVIRKPHEEFSKSHEASSETLPVVGEGEGEGVVDVVGEGESLASQIDATFQTFWNAYPRHHQTGKPGGGAPKAKTSEAWRKLKPVDREACLRAVQFYAEALSFPDAPFPAMATTWLNQKRWQDWQEPADPTKARGPSPPRDRYAEMAERFAREEVGDGQANGFVDEARRGLPAGSRS